uniref:Uncharacterized protein n=1 Tax=Anguilla anguilla TaxID=7936 RepID=A0A0E9SNC8_ANGAN
MRCPLFCLIFLVVLILNPENFAFLAKNKNEKNSTSAGFR